jgi:hypothetical protein
MTPEPAPDEATRRAARACEAALPEAFGTHRVAFGFDGFLDTVRVLVDERRDADSFDRVERLADMADHVADSAARNSSVTFEWVTRGRRTGGHVAHLSRALGTLGFDPTMVGRFGRPPAEPFAREFADRDLLSVGTPSRTDAVEFDDGKLLLPEMIDVQQFDWATMRERVGLEALAERLENLDLLGVGYWVDTPRIRTILEGLRTELFPTLSSPPDRLLFDPGDLRQIDTDRLRSGVRALTRLDGTVPVTVSANRSETAVLADAVETEEEPEPPSPNEDGDEAGDGTAPPRGGDGNRLGMAADARTARVGLGVTRLVAHGAEGAVAVTDEGLARVRAPLVRDPELTTSAGDHFNAGLAVGLLAGMDESAALVSACALAGQFVRTGDPPTPDAFRSFVGSYIDRFRDDG